MRILMLGNSFTFFHDMPRLLSTLLGEEVASNTRGGACLHDQLDLDSELGQNAQKLLTAEKWDYVVLQGHSKEPIFSRDDFEKSAATLCEMIRTNGAKPLLYATWPYQEGTEKLASTELTYAEMAAGLYEAYHAVAKANDALIADVGEMFVAMKDQLSLYEADEYHPSEVGSLLAAHIIAKTIGQDRLNLK